MADLRRQRSVLLQQENRRFGIFNFRLDGV